MKKGIWSLSEELQDSFSFPSQHPLLYNKGQNSPADFLRYVRKYHQGVYLASGIRLHLAEISALLLEQQLELLPTPITHGTITSQTSLEVSYDLLLPRDPAVLL